ncbi:hypothetical protein KIPB_000917, partial [Kipferlia bialata]
GIAETGAKPNHIVAVSAGNHSQGVSLACRKLDIPCTIVCPSIAPPSKLAATQRYGATVVPEGKSFEAALGFGMDLCKKMGGCFLHPFAQCAVIEGQGTVGVRMARENKKMGYGQLDAVLVNVGGGGLISGVALYLEGLAKASSTTRPMIIGVQAKNVAPLEGSVANGGRRKYVNKNQTTLADGCNVKQPGSAIHDIVLDEHVDKYVSVSELQIAAAVAHCLVATRTVAEGAGVLGLAALLYGTVTGLENKRVGVVVCGGNIGMNHLVNCAEFGATALGKACVVSIPLVDRPGELLRFVNEAARCACRVRGVKHGRGAHLSPEMAVVQLELWTNSFRSQIRFLKRLINMGMSPVVESRDAVPKADVVYAEVDALLAAKAGEGEVQRQTLERAFIKQETQRLRREYGDSQPQRPPASRVKL